MKFLLLLTLFVFTLSNTDVSKTSSTGAYLSFTIPQGWRNRTIEAVPARFGVPDYNGNREGRLVVPPKENSYGCHKFSASTLASWSKEAIVILQRGNCTFIQKAQNVETADLYAMVIIDHEDNPKVMSPPEDFDHSSIHKPAVMIARSHGAEILDIMKNANTKSYDMPVVAAIHWNVPMPGGIVELTLYTSSNDAEDYNFKRNFREIAGKLRAQGKIKFTPMYFIEAGKDWGCENSLYWCGDQCTNYGRYCAVDPDEMLEGMAGLHVVEENLRQMCIWNYTQVDGPLSIKEDLWWDYVDLFDDECLYKKEENGDHRMTSNCSHVVIGELGEEGLSDYVHQCFAQYGELGFESDNNNVMLDWTVEERESRDIDLIPSFAVNDFETLGSWECGVNPSKDNCNIFKAVCAGYLADEKPSLCYNDPECPAGVYKDACNKCVSDHSNDPNLECQDYLTDTTGASKSAVVGLTVVLAILCLVLGGCMFFLWKKFGEHNRVIQETKQYLSLDDEDERHHGIGLPQVQI